MTVRDKLADRNVWVFDLDNTIYSAEFDLFAQIDQRMKTYVADLLGVSPDDAYALQKQYYAAHGTTLAGLMQHHAIAPADFLDYVHAIDLSGLPPDPELADIIARLPGRKLIYTNGSAGHARRVLDKLGLTEAFQEEHHDIVAADYRPKPEIDSYRAMLERYGFEGGHAVMFEDLARNLAPAKTLGFATVLVTSTKDWSHEPKGVQPGQGGQGHDFVDFETDSLKGFLRPLVGDA